MEFQFIKFEKPKILQFLSSKTTVNYKSSTVYPNSLGKMLNICCSIICNVFASKCCR